MSFNYNDWTLQLRRAVESLGNRNGLKYPGHPNEEADAAMVEYAKARAINDAAKKRYEIARKKLTASLGLDTNNPVHNAVGRQSSTGVCIYSVQANPTRLTVDAVAAMIVKEFADVTIDEARKLVKSCQTRTPGGYVKMIVTLNNIDGE